MFMKLKEKHFMNMVKGYTHEQATVRYSLQRMGIWRY